MRTSGTEGFTIVEVLVAILLLALGLIGGTAMQLTALRTRHQSALLSNTLQLASGMAERMRANAGQMQLDDGDNPYLNVRYDVAGDGAPTAPPKFCFAAQRCAGAELAALDIYELKQQVKAALPGGRLLICRDSRQWDGARKGLRWSCDGAAGAPVVIKLGWHGKNPDGSPLHIDPLLDTPAVALALTGAVP